jgi:DNA-binding beta-propeller fold protein YncE
MGSMGRQGRRVLAAISLPGRKWIGGDGTARPVLLMVSATVLVVALLALVGVAPVMAALGKAQVSSGHAHSRISKKSPRSQRCRHGASRGRHKIVCKHPAVSEKGLAGAMPSTSRSTVPSPILGTLQPAEPFPASPASPSLSSPTPQPPITVSPGGWIHYNNSPVETAQTQFKETKIVSGKPMPGGGCSFGGPGTVPPGTTEIVEEETAYNPTTCEAVVVRAGLTQRELTQLEASQGSSQPSPSGAAEPTESGQSTAPESMLGPEGPRTAVTPRGRVMPSTTSETHYRSAHDRDIWRDPFTANITSLIADLSWPLNGAEGPVGTKVYSYEFSWDQWSNTGQKGPYLTKGFGLYGGSTLLGNKAEAELSWNWYNSTHETFYNTDFPHLLEHIYIVSGISLANLLCEELGKTTEFYHNIKVFGYQSNAMAYWSEDSKKGACSNLVKHVVYAGWGWDGPENEKVGLEYQGIIASSEYEQEAEQTIGEEGLAPVVNTIAATPLKEGEVALNGDVNPNGRDTAYNFEYGPTETYGSFGTEGNAGSGTSPVYESHTLTRLQPGAIYHYRIFGVNSGGISYGPDQTFRAPQRPTVATEAATEVQETSALLHCSVNPNELETHVDFQYGETPGYGSTTPEGSVGSGTEGVPVGVTITGLHPGKTYYYRCVAWNAGGTSHVSGATFVPEGPEAGSPSIVTGDGELLVFSRNNIGELIAFARSPSSGEWSAWDLTSLAGGDGWMEVSHPYIAAMPEPILQSNGEPEVFAQRNNGELVAFNRAPGGGWSAWNVTGLAGGEGYMEVAHPSITASPEPIIAPNGELLVFAQRTNGEVVSFAQQSGGGWKAWNITGLAGGEGYMEVKHPSITGSPEPIIGPDGLLEVFAERTNGELVSLTQYSGGGWAGWNITGLAGGEGYMEVKHPSIAASPSPVIANTKELNVFAQRPNGEVVSFVQASGGGWNAWNITGLVGGHPSIASRPIPIAPGKGEPLVFGQTAGGELLNIYRSVGGGWSDWEMNPLLLEDRTFTTLPEPPVDTAPSTVSPTAPVQGVPETATTGTWTNSPTSYAYQWERCNASGGECSNISGASSSSYTPVAADVEHTLVVKVTATNGGGANFATSSATGKVKPSSWTYSSQLGAGDFAYPVDAAVDAHGDVWVTNAYGNDIEEFSSSGTRLGTYTKYGTGSDEVEEPGGIAVNKSTGNVYVADYKNSRVDELNEKGEFVRAFGWNVNGKEGKEELQVCTATTTCKAGKAGSGAGQFNASGSLFVDASGNVWVTDGGNDRVQEFTEKGEFVKTFGWGVNEKGTEKLETCTSKCQAGKSGSGNGQFSVPAGIAVSGGHVYVVDSGNDRVEELGTEGAYVTKFGAKGSGEVQFSAPGGMAVDSSGNLYVADTGNNRIEELSSSGAYITQFGKAGTGNNEFKEPEGLAIGSTGNAYVVDSGNSRVEVWAP